MRRDREDKIRGLIYQNVRYSNYTFDRDLSREETGLSRERGEKSLTRSPILSPVAKEAIRQAYAQPGATLDSVAKQFGVSLSTVYLYIDLETKPPKIACPICGQQVRSSQSSLHRQGVFHQQSQRIKALLDQECMTFTEIGDRLGVSRERVRQIAKELGIIGQPRKMVCTIRRRKQKRVQVVKERFHPKLMKRLVVCGVTDVDFLSVQSSSIVINGKRVAITQSTKLQRMYPTGIVVYAHIGTRGSWTREGYDYLIAYVIPKNDCYVIPASWLPSNVYIPYGRIKNCFGGNQRDWTQWLERFDLLLL